MKRVWLAGLLLLISKTAFPGWIDRSHTIFLPPAMSEKLGATQAFPLFWWNFLVLENSAENPEKVMALCRALRDAPDSPLEKIPCGADLSTFLPILRDWARDYPLRHPFPGRSEVRQKFAATFAQASLPVGRELLGVFREDPLGSATELKTILESQVKMDLPNQGGFFIDRTTKRVVIPLQFKTPPTQTLAIEIFYRVMKTTCEGSADACPVMTLVGPHASTYANERQVQHDIEHVSLIGLLLTGGQILFLIFSRRSRALWLFPPVLLATAVAVGATVAIFGSIHGLTIAFGTGLIGLAIDYGLHSAFNISFRGVWRANLCGIMTTVAGFGVMLFSQVPLLRQLMVFALIGLVTAYFLFYFLHSRYGAFFAIKPFSFEPKATKARTIGILAILAAAVPAAVLLRPNLSMTQFDFHSPRDIEVQKWLYSHLGVKASLLELDPSVDLDAAVLLAHARQDWADTNRISLQSVAHFLPASSEANRNLKTWSEIFCAHGSPSGTPLADLSRDERRFFSPAIARLSCDALRSLGSGIPIYARDFHAAPAGGTPGGFLSVWLPKDDAETDKVKAIYPKALSFREVVDIFPRTLSAELKWMAPLSVLLASFFLFLYYRRMDLTLLALVPFFCATGVYAIAVFTLGLSFSFISMVALLMIFGFSIDYGVFAVDVTLEPEGRSVTGVWTCLLFASVATGLGFVPLLICHHPVLAHLGQTLTSGAIGTAIGTLWGIPGIAGLARIQSKKGETP